MVIQFFCFMKIYKQWSNFEKKKSLAQQRHRPEFLARNEAFLVRFFSLQSIALATFLRATCRKGNKRGKKFWNLRQMWCLTKPFFSHVVYVIPVVEVGNKLFNFMVRLSDHGWWKRPVFWSWARKWHIHEQGRDDGNP